MPLARQLSRNLLVACAVAFICLDALSIVLGKSDPNAASYPFLILAPALACAVTFYRAKTSVGRTRTGWVLLSTALAIWTLGMSLSALADMTEHVPVAVAWFSDFSYFVYGVPVLLILSLPVASERLPIFFWLDAIQAVLTALLIYVGLFGALPFLGQPLRPTPTALLVFTYNMENIVLAVVCSVRYLTISDRGEVRRRYALLTSFLWVYALCAGLYNALYVPIVLHAQKPMGELDILPVVPFLFLTVAVLDPWPGQISTVSATSGTLELFVDNASPILYTLAVLVLGIFALRSHFYLGVFAIVVALAVYAIRSIVLQLRYIRTQGFLSEARDRLEAISLQDALTGIANRRCFDQTLEVEWNRAARNRSPLSLIFIDIDHFKAVNDLYGHPHGDAVLVQVAAALHAALPRSGDLLARYGGEEFAVILASSSGDAAEVVATRMLEAVRALDIVHGPVTISAGFSTCHAHQEGSKELLIATADEGLYMAKDRGRNRVESAGQSKLVW